MTPEKLNHFRRHLEELAGRVAAATAGLEEAARSPTSGEAAGGLSNAPLHLADAGSEAFSQTLNATLLENEQFIRGEVADARARLDAGTFGVCEECQCDIPDERLEALPYARHCVRCATKLEAGSQTNLHRGRPAGWGSTLDHPASLAANRRAGESSPSLAGRNHDDEAEDRHAAGTPGGGTAVGGLAGTNAGDGDPTDEPLEDAMGSGNFDVADDPASDTDDATDAYSGRAGGAVGGTPANKRATGGRDNTR